MTRPWQAERSLGVEEIRRLLRWRFPEIEAATITDLGAGWDNAAVLVDGRWVFRFPRREAALVCLSAEMRVLPGLVGRLPLAIPQLTFVHQGDERHPWPFVGYALLAGRTACAAALDAGARERAAAPLGEFLARLHAIGVEEGAGLGALPDACRRLEVEALLESACQRLHRLATRGLIGQTDALMAALTSARGCTPQVSGLVHGDLYVRHLIVDEASGLSGIIDWGDVHLNDPAQDLGIAWGFLPPSARTVFRDHYGAISDSTWRLARFRAILAHAIMVEYAADIQDAALLREAQLALSHAGLD